MTARAIPLVAVAVLVVTAGCGGSQPDHTPSATPSAAPSSHDSWDVSQMPDPCRTISLPEVTAVVADQVTGGIRLDSWPPLCAFTIVGQPPLEYVYLSDDSRSAAKDDFDRQRSDSATPETVDGIGDKAYWLPDYTALHVLSGGTHLTVKFAGPRPLPDPRNKAIALARIALPRAKTTS